MRLTPQDQPYACDDFGDAEELQAEPIPPEAKAIIAIIGACFCAACLIVGVWIRN